jgi:hypothetical protein
MADNPSFFRKVVRFVANPATDWTNLNTRLGDTRELELEKSELKAMIERKRRNDFVRKREFDVLRRVRREGLSPEQLAALGGSSRIDDSEARLPDPNAGRQEKGVKAKIDEIEQQMVGDGFRPSSRRGGLLGGSSVAGALARLAGAELRPAQPRAGRDISRDSSSFPTYPPPAPSRDFANPHSRSLPYGGPMADRGNVLPPPPPRSPAVYPYPPRVSAPAPLRMSTGLPPLASPQPTPDTAQQNPAAPRAAPVATKAGVLDSLPPLDLMPDVVLGQGRDPGPGDNAPDWAVEVNEAVHDPELDEAVIAFANADFTQCENALAQLTSVGGVRAQHAETWLVLFDLYRATGQQQRFESLAMEYAHQFGWSAPQWYSLPKLVAEAVANEPVLATHSSHTDPMEVGWVCPAQLDIEAVARLRSQTLQLPLPWVFDWSNLRSIDPEAGMQLSMLFRLWSGQALEMRWVAGDKLFDVLAEAAPTGVRDADPVFWLTRLDALRLANRVDQFDEAAIDYCVTYEVSPPSWEAARCNVRISSANPNTRNPQMSRISEVSTSFLESTLLDQNAGVAVEMAHVELSGQLVGDIGETLRKLETGLASAPIVSVSCARLIRVDFIAAGDLLNWVLNQRNDNRAVHFVDAHRLLALFFGAMGINEHAKVQVRKV